MDIKQEIVDSIQVIVDSAIKKVCPIITFGVVLSVIGKNKCIVKVNNIDYKLSYYGKASPDLNQKYPVFVPFGKMNLAFILTSGGGSNVSFGLIIKGYYTTYEDLVDSVPQPQVGDAYGVGNDAPYDIYIWDSIKSEWVNNGNLKGETGSKGETGNGIASVELISGTHAAGTFDTYQITFTDGNFMTFKIYNGENGATGNGIVSVNLISGTHAAGTLDTYQIQFTNGTTTNFEVYNGAVGATGNGIASIQLIGGTHASGTSDTYRITFTDGSYFDFMVYNGSDGLGSGDMMKSVYDTKLFSTDIYAYTDGMLGKTTEFNADGSITETTPLWTKVTTFNADGSITEKITYKDDTWRQKITVFNTDGSITETVTEGSQ